MVETLVAGMSSEALPLSAPNQIARFPYSARFLVDDSKRLLRESANVIRVQDLFGVACFIQSQHSGPGEWVTIGGNSQELVEKAKCYVFAMCLPEVHSDLSRGGRLAGLLWGQTSNLHVVLERSFLVYIQHLTSAEGTSVIRVQGSKQQVMKTMSRLHSIADTIESEYSPPPPPNHSLSPPPHPSPIRHLPAPAMVDNADFLKAFSVLPQEDKQAWRVYHDSQPSLVPRSSVDPVMQRNIDYYATQLGYPRDKVEATLESLGPKASVNEIIQRLNKVSSRVPSVGTNFVKPPVTVGPTDYVRPMGDCVRTIGLEEAGGLVNNMIERLPRKVDSSKLRPVVIDGSNVAMRHGNGQVFSCRGIQLVVDYFKNRGHDHIKVFVPEWRKESSRPETPISNQHILDCLEKEGILIYTPSRKISGRRIVCYDDRYIIRYAHLEGGVIVSNDQYRDLMQENPEWRRVIEQHLLQFVFANDHFMPPDDPLGKSGPTLDAFLRKDPREQHGVIKKVTSEVRNNSMPICPHLGNCTFGRKCRYYHPDREPQKVEHATGSGSSGGSYTPSTSSRSATPSPSPDNRSHSIKSSREDLYGLSSRYSSSDDLYRGDKVLSGEISTLSNRDMSDLTDKFSQTSIGQTSPSKQPYADSYHGQGGTHISIKFSHPPAATGQVKTAPVIEGSFPVLPPLAEGGRPQNHTFPLAQVPHHNARPGNVTEEHQYHGQQSHVHLNHGMQSTMLPFEDCGVGNSQPLLPRDPCQGSQYPQTQYPAPQGGGHYPQANDFGGVVDSAHLRRDLQTQHSALSSRYVNSRTRNPPYSSQAMNSYDQSIPLHNLHQQHFSPNHQLLPQGYANMPRPVPQGQYQEGGYHRSDGYPATHNPPPLSPRQELFRMLQAALPNCEGRIKDVMHRHPQLSSQSDFSVAMELIQRLE